MWAPMDLQQANTSQERTEGTGPAPDLRFLLYCRKWAKTNSKLAQQVGEAPGNDSHLCLLERILVQGTSVGKAAH